MKDNDIQIPREEPFKNDILNRKPIAENFTKIFNNMDGNLVVGIDAPWGTGKTTFIKMWKEYLASIEDYKTIYFNAWENDDSDDPLLAIIYQLEEQYNGKNDKIDNIKKYGAQLIKKTVPIGLRLLTNGILDVKDVKLGEFNESEFVDLAGKLGEVEYSKFKQSKNAKSEFKKTLIEFQKEQNKKIIFFIDELDRCRPSFAIETLEKIKHLFDIDNYFFIISLDKQQLSCSISTLYGQDMDSLGYLRRFIDLDYSLPIPDKRNYVEMMINTYKLNRDNWFWVYLKKMIDLMDYSLRDIDKLFYYLKIILPSTIFHKDGKEYSDAYSAVMGIVYSFLISIKLKKPLLYNKIVLKNYKTSSLINEININDIKLDKYFNNQLRLIMIDTLSAFLNRNLKSNAESKYEDFNLKFDSIYGEYNLNRLWENNKCIVINQLDFLDNFFI
ncbi:hypothetical protein GOQ27_14390 [Clostridium sp. D2Q-11]|uniref:KAP NTPase domain-containing protein n=1 Tax=Anaeromonas frigoriresistens TaxID=2683708 RepID=A0A942ZAC3_9FIRM|nr:P-loop NTPase fold protein [Anaeromonas frigoriresistens]MBS4539660.1 hypothetical protein [Anaeromonas frigoriresistens]